MDSLTVTRRDDGAYVLTVVHARDIESPDGSTIFTFTEIERLKRSEFNVCVGAILHIEDDVIAYPTQRLNLGSRSSVKEYISTLEKLSNKRREYLLTFANVVQSLTAEIDAQRDDVPASELVALKGEDQRLFYPFLTDKSANLFFGDGSSTKTFITLRLGISLITGHPFLGYKPSRKCNVLFLDYEDQGGKFRNRLDMISNGMTESVLNEDLDRFIYQKAKGTPLSELVNNLKEVIARRKIDLIIIDSAAYACASEIEKADGVIRFFNALDNLQVTSLIIAHVTKGNSESEDALKGSKHAIGSIFFHNGPRNIWNVVGRGEEEEHETLKNICLYHRKCNDGMKHRFIPLEVDFTLPDTVQVRLGQESRWQEAWTSDRRILNCLGDKSMTRGELKENLTGMNENTLKYALKKLMDSGKIYLVSGQGGPYKAKK